MSRRFKPIGLALVAGAAMLPSFANADAIEPRATEITQQSGEVTGVVEDALGPVTGASVIVKGTTNGIITDLDGKFTLS